MEQDGDKLKDVETLKTNLQTEWAEFIPTTQTTGVNTSNPPKTSNSEVDLGSLSMADYIAARKKG